MSEQQRLLTVENLRVTFDIMPRNAWPWTRPQPLKAVNNVSFTLNEGETLGIVGESGCGKSTLARAIMGMVPSQAGKVVWLGSLPFSCAHSEDIVSLGTRSHVYDELAGRSLGAYRKRTWCLAGVTGVVSARLSCPTPGRRSHHDWHV